MSDNKLSGFDTLFYTFFQKLLSDMRASRRAQWLPGSDPYGSSPLYVCKVRLGQILHGMSEYAGRCGARGKRGKTKKPDFPGRENED